MLWHARQRSRKIYPAERMEVSQAGVEVLALVSVTYGAIQLPIFWPVRLAVLGSCTLYVLVGARHLLLVRLKHHQMNTLRPLAVWPVYVAIRHYLARGEVRVSIGPFVGDYYTVTVTRANGEYLLAATVRRLQAFRLLQSLGAHYPPRERMQAGWATYSLRIDTLTPNAPARAQHTIAPVGVILPA